MGRPVLAAMGLFVGGLVVGSLPNAGANRGTAYAATEQPEAHDPSPRARDRGPLAPALRAIERARLRGDPTDIDPLSWTGGSSRAAGARCSLRRRDVDVPADDPLAGLTMPDLPIPRQPEVLKYIRYFTESHAGRKSFSEALRRSGRYKDIITASFRALGLPESLLAVAFVESGFSPQAVSTAGAAGLWQFMPSTARAYGLSIETTIDERASIWRSTDAAAHHLGDLYDRFRSWELALAAYNLGYDRVDHRLDEFDADDFWSLADAPGALPRETKHYVPKVLAAAVVFANLAEFGFQDVERAPPIDATELEVPGGTRLAVIARAAGTSVRALRGLNPELLADVVPDRGEPAVVHVPRDGLSRARAMLPTLLADGADAAPRVSDEFDWGRDDLRAGRSRLERASSRPSRLPPRHHRTRHHDRDAKVARDERRREAPREAPRREASRELPSALPRDLPRERLAREEPAPHAAPPPLPPPSGSAAKTARVLYRVVAGDSIRQIAATLGVTVDQILAQAHVARAADIKVGTLLDLQVPSGGVDLARAPAPALADEKRER